MTLTQSQAEPGLKREEEASLTSGILLVGGTSIGAGMLALPLVTGIAGFFPAMVVNTLCWLFMLATGLLLLEATLWMKDGEHLLSVAQKILGPIGKLICGISFVFLYYCLLVSYIAGGTPLFVETIGSYLGLHFVGFSGYFLFASLLGFLIFLGHRVVDRTNKLFVISLIFSYVLLVSIGSTEVKASYLFRREWGLTMMGAPIFFSAYGYHNIIPSMTGYLKRNVNKLRLSIIVGTAIPYLVYSLWQWMIIGTLAQDAIASTAAEGTPITLALQKMTGNPWISGLGAYFGFFALVTSFLGVSLSMVDFFGDGLKLPRQGISRAGLCFLVFLPPTLFAAVKPDIFASALSLAGGFGEAILNGLFPIAFVWIGRYRMKLNSQRQLPGGRVMLIILALATFWIIGLEIQSLFGAWFNADGF
ncbi:MAG: aromatic amino acid transport family protein [Waddliaceae bacterium]